jgi:hypothetical protein
VKLVAHENFPLALAMAVRGLLYAYRALMELCGTQAGQANGEKICRTIN